MASRPDMARAPQEEEQERTVEIWRLQELEHRAYSKQMIAGNTARTSES